MSHSSRSARRWRHRPGRSGFCPSRRPSSSSATGLGIPADVAVAGFDDHALSPLVSPPLTTVSWDTPRVAGAAAAMLVDAIDGRRRIGRELVVAPRLIVRSSTAPNGVRPLLVHPP